MLPGRAQSPRPPNECKLPMGQPGVSFPSKISQTIGSCLSPSPILQNCNVSSCFLNIFIIRSETPGHFFFLSPLQRQPDESEACVGSLCFAFLCRLHLLLLFSLMDGHGLRMRNLPPYGPMGQLCASPELGLLSDPSKSLRARSCAATRKYHLTIYTR